MEQHVRQITTQFQLNAISVRKYLSSRARNVWIFMILVTLFSISVALRRELWFKKMPFLQGTSNTKSQYQVSGH